MSDPYSTPIKPKRKQIDTRRNRIRPEGWNIWKGLRYRCKNAKAKNYRRYGGRGIDVCAGIDKSYLHFIKTIGPRPTQLHEVDRKNNDLGYHCGNCDDCKTKGQTLNIHWATKSENGNNTSVNRHIEWRGETKTLHQWLTTLGLTGNDYHRTRQRLYEGWPVEKAFTVGKVAPGTTRHNPNKAISK